MKDQKILSYTVTVNNYPEPDLHEEIKEYIQNLGYTIAHLSTCQVRENVIAVTVVLIRE